MTKQITRVWSFASDSNPNIEYQTLQYIDGTTSCNCKGWTRRVAADGSRSCKQEQWTWELLIEPARPPTATTINNIKRKETMPTITHSKSHNSDTASSPSESMKSKIINYIRAGRLVLLTMALQELAVS